MVQPSAWQGEAFNPVPHSDNRIHSDEVAHAYGFRGGLVPGVVVSAYLLQPAIEAWGEDWLERGAARCVVRSPVCDREPFHVGVEAEERAYRATLVDPRGERCATADVSLPEAPPAPPAFRGDPVFERGAPRAPATREALEVLRTRGLCAMRARWDVGAEITHYLRNPSQMPALVREGGYASPAFVLGLSNWMLAGNVQLDPWLHLQTESQNHAPIPHGSELLVEAEIADLFEKKGHEFVDAEMGVFFADTHAPAARVRLRAIYRLRPPGV